MTKGNNKSGKRQAKLEVTARIVGEDGNIVVKKVESSTSFTCSDDLDLCTKDGFLDDFDKLEKAVLDVRKQMEQGIAEAYLEQAAKKNEKNTQEKD